MAHGSTAQQLSDLELEEAALAAAHAELPADDSPGAPPGFDQEQYSINMAKMMEQLEAMAAELRKSQSETAKWKSMYTRGDGAHEPRGRRGRSGDAGADAGAASFHPMTPQKAEGAGHPTTTPKSWGDWGHGTAGGAAPHADPWGAQPDPWTKSNWQRKDAGQSGGSQSEGNLQTAPERQDGNLQTAPKEPWCQPKQSEGNLKAAQNGTWQRQPWSQQSEGNLQTAPNGTWQRQPWSQQSEGNL